MSHVHEGPLATYNSLTDPNLSGYFGNTRMRRHLKKSGLVSRRGQIISENQYRLNMARREHKKHVKDLLAQAIVHKTLDLERYRQVEIKKKLEEIAKIELVRRVRATRGRKGDEEVLPYLSPRSHSRPQSGKHSDASSGHRRPKSAPAPPRHRQQSAKSGYTDSYEDVIYVDDNGRPVSPPPPSDRQSFKDSLRDVRPENIDTRHLYALDSEALQQYALRLSKNERGRDGASSPYLLSQIPQPPKRERARSAKSPRRSGRMSARPDSSRRPGVQNDSGERSQKDPSTVEGALMLHRSEPAMMHQGEVQTLCEITMKYHGPNLTLPRDQFDPTQEVSIEQQHCGGNTLPVFKERLQAGSSFSFISRRHRGYPFSLTLYIDGRVDCRVSTCCEYKHGIGVKLGGKMGHFSLTGITGATPCYKCKLSVQAPPRSLKLKKSYSRKKKQDTGEVVTVEGTPRKVMTPTTPKEEPQKSDDDNYDDDFEEEDSKENKYADDFEDEVEEQVEEPREDDRRHIIGLRDDETRVNGKTISVDVAEKEKEQKKEGTVPQHRHVEGYSSEDEDAEGPRSKSIEVTADIHSQNKGSPKRRRRSSSSSSSSSSNSSDKEETPRPQTPERKTRSPEYERVQETAVIQVHTARSEESAPPRSDRSERSTTSGSLTTETESTLESSRQQVVLDTRKGKKGSSSSSSSSLSSDSEDEKYQRKKREKRQRQENEKRRKDEEEKRKKETEEREVERRKQLEEEERKRKEAEEERKKRFELQRQQSQDRLRQMEEQRKKQELERQQQMSEQTKAKEEERKRRQVEEERIQRDYEKQLSFIQSQRESESTLSVSEETKSEVKVEVPPKKEEKRRSSSSSSSSSSESESDDEKKKGSSPFSVAIASLKTEEAVQDKRREETSSSTETSSSSGSVKEQASVVQPMQKITEEEKKETRRASSSSASSSSSSSSGGEYTVSKETKQEEKKLEAETVISKQETTEAEQKKLRSSSSSSESESDEDNKKGTEKKEDVKKEITEAAQEEQPKKVRKGSTSSTSSSSSSSYSRSYSRSDNEFKSPEDFNKKAETETKEKEDVKITGSVSKEEAKPERKGSLTTASSLSSSYSASESESDAEFKPAEAPKEPAPFGGIQHETTLIDETELKQEPVILKSAVPDKEVEKNLKKEESEDSSSDSSSSDSDSSDSEDEKDKTKPKEGSKPVTSESETETMHGGHDPENVAKSGTSVESHLVKTTVRAPMAHYGSILPMVKDSNAVELNGVKLDDSQLTEINNFIAEVEHIKSVTLRNCGLDDTSFQNTALSLQVTQSSPNILNFSKNQLGARSLQPLSVAIKQKPSIEIVILNGNPVGNVGCKVLIDALVKTKDPFPFLRRGSGYMTPSEARQQKEEGKDVNLEEDTKDGCNVKELDLGDCKIADAGIAELSRFLESNKTLTSLNLNGNGDISASGWERLGQAMKKNKTLKTLSLDFTNIGDSGLENLAKGLRVNTGLRSLELESSGLTEKGGKILRDLLKSNTSILEVTVTPGNDISDDTLEEIRKYLALNNTGSA